MYTYIIIGYVFVYVIFENRFNRMTLSVLVYGFTECTRNARLTSHRMLNSVKETLSLSMYLLHSISIYNIDNVYVLDGYETSTNTFVRVHSTMCIAYARKRMCKTRMCTMTFFFYLGFGSNFFRRFAVYV